MVLAQFCLCNQRVPANRSVNGKSHIRVFPILVLDLAGLDELD